jgi:hypothetical protein
LQLYADGGYQLRIRRLEGTPNYGPRHHLFSLVSSLNGPRYWIDRRIAGCQDVALCGSRAEVGLFL